VGAGAPVSGEDRVLAGLRDDGAGRLARGASRYLLVRPETLVALQKAVELALGERAAACLVAGGAGGEELHERLLVAQVGKHRPERAGQRADLEDASRPDGPRLHLEEAAQGGGNLDLGQPGGLRRLERVSQGVVLELEKVDQVAVDVVPAFHPAQDSRRPPD